MSWKKVWLVLFGLMLAGGIYAIIYRQMAKEKQLTWPKKYVYNLARPSMRHELFIRDLDYRKEYLQYTKDALAGERQVSIKFPLDDNSLPKGQEVYVRRYLADSILVEFYSPNFHHKLWGFTTGYINRNFLHDSLQNK